MRAVHMNERQSELIERYIVALMRSGETENASLMMSLQLEYKFSDELGPPLPDNVVAFPDQHSVSAS